MHFHRLNYVCNWNPKKIPFVIFLDDGKALYKRLRTIDGLGSCDAIRAASLYLAALHDVTLKNPMSLFTNEELYKLDRYNFLMKIITHLVIEMNDSTHRALNSFLAARSAASNATPSIDAVETQRTAEEEHSFIVNVLDPFYNVKQAAPLRKVSWPPALFFCGDNIPLAGPCSLTGPARTIIYGPYLHLPPGDWVATVDFQVADNLSGNVIVSDITSSVVIHSEDLVEKELARGEFGLPVSGLFTFEQAFEVASPLETLQIRFSTKEGAIEGSFAMRKITVSRA